jgi:hypothetical protein
VRFVAADVQVRPGRQRGQFPDHVLDEPVRGLGRDAQRAVPDRGVGARRWRDPVAGEFRVGDLGGVHVPRHVDLGHDGDEARGGVPDQVAILRLGEEAAADAVHAGAGRGPDRGEPRPAVDLDAPALVVGEMQVQVVDLEAADLVDVPLDLVRGVEVPGEVQHRAAVGEPRVVHDGAARDGPVPHQLAQRLGAGEQAGRGVRPEGHGVAPHPEPVALAADRVVTGREDQRDLRHGPRRERRDRQRLTGGPAQVAGQPVGDRAGGRPGPDHRDRADPEVGPGRGRHLGGRRDDVAQRGGGRGLGRDGERQTEGRYGEQ